MNIKELANIIIALDAIPDLIEDRHVKTIHRLKFILELAAQVKQETG